MQTDEKELSLLLEGVLFASGEPVSVERLSSVLKYERDDILACAKALADEYSFERRGVRLIRLEDSLQMVSAPELAERIRAVLETRRPPKLSPAAVEVLSIIAYYQPVTRAQIEQIRGVDSSYTVSALLTRGLVAEAGQLDAPGRPMQFETTPAFLRVFGIKSLSELPPLPGEKS